jgi:hypothetical protein
MSSESKRAAALRYLSHRPRRILRWGEAACRESGARRGLRHDGSYDENERGGKGKERVVGKAAGDERVFIYLAESQTGR